MDSLVERLRAPLAIIELVFWLPASCSGLMLAAAYSVSGNSSPVTLIAGFLLVPITFLMCPVYALGENARAHPRRAAIALALPLVALGLTYVAELPSLT